MLARLHEFWTRIGIKPAVGDAFVGGVAICVANWIVVGGPFDWDGVRGAAYLFILGAIGVAAPPAARTVMTRGGVRPRDPLHRR